MFFTGLSWFSIIVATIVAFFAGWLYYSPFLFGKQFAKEMGWTKEQMEHGKEKGGMFQKFGLVLLGEFIMSIVAASLIHSLFVTSFSQVFIIAISLWLGFVIFPKLNNVLFGKTSWRLFAVNIGQDLLSILVIFIIVSLFNR